MYVLKSCARSQSRPWRSIHQTPSGNPFSYSENKVHPEHSTFSADSCTDIQTTEASIDPSLFAELIWRNPAVPQLSFCSSRLTTPVWKSWSCHRDNSDKVICFKEPQITRSKLGKNRRLYWQPSKTVSDTLVFSLSLITSIHRGVDFEGLVWGHWMSISLIYFYYWGLRWCNKCSVRL